MLDHRNSVKVGRPWGAGDMGGRILQAPHENLCIDTRIRGAFVALRASSSRGKGPGDLGPSLPFSHRTRRSGCTPAEPYPPIRQGVMLMAGSSVYKNNVATGRRLKHATLPVARKALNAGLAGRRTQRRRSETQSTGVIPSRKVFRHRHVHDVSVKWPARICVRSLFV